MRKTQLAEEAVAYMNILVEALQANLMASLTLLRLEDSNSSKATEALNETNLTKKIALMHEIGCVNNLSEQLIEAIKTKIIIDGLIAPNPRKMPGADTLKQNDLERALIAYREGMSMVPTTSDTDSDTDVVNNRGGVASEAGMFAASHVKVEENTQTRAAGPTQQGSKPQ